MVGARHHTLSSVTVTAMGVSGFCSGSSSCSDALPFQYLQGQPSKAKGSHSGGLHRRTCMLLLEATARQLQVRTAHAQTDRCDACFMFKGKQHSLVSGQCQIQHWLGVGEDAREVVEQRERHIVHEANLW